jgi:hypothetical protein
MQSKHIGLLYVIWTQMVNILLHPLQKEKFIDL